jgi:putative transposase
MNVAAWENHALHCYHLNMPEYRRPFAPGGTFFFTGVTQDRQPILCSVVARTLLRSAIETTRTERPFELLAFVLFDEHLHSIWELPPGDSDFSTRWGAIKGRFTRAFLLQGGRESAVSTDRARHGGRGIWQARFYDHLIRDEQDFSNHLDYVHFNPVKHGRTECPHAYPFSTFGKWVKKNAYERDWCCSCAGRKPSIPNFSWADEKDLE